MRKLLLAVLLSSAACTTIKIPDTPKLTYFGVYPNIVPPGFYGIDGLNKQNLYLPFNASPMIGGQCLSGTEFQTQQEYINQLKAIIIGE